jgi:methylmalonyl-CoA/ethylmalonyl-CoA epimerase
LSKKIAVERIAHIAIAVHDLSKHIPYYRDVLGLELVGQEEVADQQVRVAMFRVGETHIELLEPSSETSPIARYLSKRGEGIHHIAFELGGSLQGALDELRDKGVALLDDAPRDGAHGARIAFAHPRSTFGVLTEFCQSGGEHES